MKRFTFRLQAVLDLAGQQEEEEQLRLAQLQKECYLIDEKITRTCEERQALMNALAVRQRECFDPHEMDETRLRLRVLGLDKESLQHERLAIEQRVSEQQSRVVEAMRERQMLEKLRDKQRNAYLKEMERNELRTMEEAILPRLARAHAVEQGSRGY